MGNLRDRRVVASRLWDWEFLNECFQPTRIRISDVDGEVERNGFILRLEGKPLGGCLSEAQTITFTSLSQFRRGAHPAFTILVLYGEPGVPRAMQIWPREIIRCTTEDVQRFVREWFVWASAGSRSASGGES